MFAAVPGGRAIRCLVAGHGRKYAFRDLLGGSFHWMLSLATDHLAMMQRFIGVLCSQQTVPSLRLPAFPLYALRSAAELKRRLEEEHFRDR